MAMMLGALAALGSVPAAAQGCGGLSLRADSARAEPGRAPDILIAASATAREVRFESQPQIRIGLNGCAALDSVVTTRRENLPDPVQPGVAYRDVRVGVEIRAWLNVQCLPALAAADPALCAPVQIRTNAQPPAGEPAPANPPGR
ncbi:MAG TPA: hypothetical protein VGC13_32360 [Longimicrobium sp.]|jgi:hypothetical protein|uniref:hypothetical protein n=1 Tax=Longimicrobium sp. TaxID=2029185 RepID=UPI002ED9F56E